MSNDSTDNTGSLNAPKQANRVMWWLLAWLVFAAMLACGVVYLEHRLSQFATGIVNQQAKASLPLEDIEQTLHIHKSQIDATSATVKSLRAAVDSQASELQHLKDEKDKLADTNITNALATEIAAVKTKLETLEKDLAAERAHVSAYARILRDITVLQGQLGSEKSTDTLKAITSALTEIPVMPDTLSTRAQLASTLESLQHLTKANDILPQEALLEELSDVMARHTHVQKPKAQTSDSKSFWQKLSAEMAGHIRIRPDADAALEDALEELSQAVHNGSLDNATAIIARLKTAPEDLTVWVKKARVRVRADSLLQELQRLVGNLASEA